ncbi:hypothetical protein NPIL_89651 [Nephila pilipes]|uniref:Uncharacterized protein n=1 Tax=Nephila pilipes TaxID=299642 RepID=A0A8X6TA49_NEPPI|nr:hypothetical protein NPIL_89651 [Nephila pilipes]
MQEEKGHPYGHVTEKNHFNFTSAHPHFRKPLFFHPLRHRPLYYEAPAPVTTSQCKYSLHAGQQQYLKRHGTGGAKVRFAMAALKAFGRTVYQRKRNLQAKQRCARKAKWWLSSGVLWWGVSKASSGSEKGLRKVLLALQREQPAYDRCLKREEKKSPAREYEKGKVIASGQYAAIRDQTKPEMKGYLPPRRMSPQSAAQQRTRANAFDANPILCKRA